MGFRTNTSPIAALNATSETASTSVGLTIPGQAGKSIYLTGASFGYTLGQTNTQKISIFDGVAEIFRVMSGTIGLTINFPIPLRISEGTNAVMTTSVSANTQRGVICAFYYVE